MNEKKVAILTMLEKGEIDAGQAFAMLSQVKDTPEPPPVQASPPTQAPPPVNHNQGNYNHHHEEHSWIEETVDGISSALSSVFEEIKEMDIGHEISSFFGGGFTQHKNTQSFVSEPILMGQGQAVIGGLSIIGLNAPVTVVGYPGDTIKLTVNYNARHADAEMVFTSEGGHYKLIYDNKRFRSVEIYCQVPQAVIKQLHCATKNAGLTIENLATGNCQLYTTNAKLMAHAVSATTFVAQTTNGGLHASNIAGQNIHLFTTNAKVRAENIKADTVEIKTSNASVKPTGVDANKIIITTSNASLKLEEIFNGMSLDFTTQRHIQARTSNSNIRFHAPHGVGMFVEARGADLSNKSPEMHFEKIDKKLYHGESANYHVATHKINVSLGTSHGSIKIV